MALKLGRRQFLSVILGLCLYLGAFQAQAYVESFRLFNLESRPVKQKNCTFHLISPPAELVRLQDERDVIVMAWNVENVMERTGKYEYSGLDTHRHVYTHQYVSGKGPRPVADWKFEAKQRKILSVGRLLGIDGEPLPHFIVSPEVESVRAADWLFNSADLAGEYRTYLVKGNDDRGINIAFAVRADLDVVVTMETHREAKWEDPVEGAVGRLFSRDLPVMIVRDGGGRPLMLLMGNHAKSMRDRAGGRDPKSGMLRSAQYQAVRKIVASYRKRFGDRIPILFAGDFNTDLRTSKEVAPLKGILKDSFDIMNVKERITQTYHPQGGATVASQLDAIMVSPSAEKHLRRARVLPEFDFVSGKPLGLPRSYNERRDHFPSDHRAIAISLDGKVFQR